MRLRALAFAAMMAAMAVLLQTGPLWLSEPAGYGLSIWASLPPAMAALFWPREAVWASVATVLLCLILSPQEAIVFGLTNGLFGLVMGMTRHANLPPWRSILLAAGALFGGMVVLTWGIGVAALGEEMLESGVALALAAYAGFAILWSALFTGLFRLICRRVLRGAEASRQLSARR